MDIIQIKKDIRALPRSEKFHLIQFLVSELSREEQELSHYFEEGSQHGFWSQHNAFEAARKLQTLLDDNKV
ncbi:hypothetical protein [Desulfonema magnum]|uniref:Uncharacterized protein n=1 Tax=Desulfonema magnum TaxID=45655 RepID=A0A975BY20_9BACT|nr:hypothetical protein [Desulfonema magnum]QTA93951.1 Uncharacterized protein dnm_100600 [Desulfonema magnum]